MGFGGTKRGRSPGSGGLSESTNKRRSARKLEHKRESPSSCLVLPSKKDSPSSALLSDLGFNCFPSPSNLATDREPLCVLDLGPINKKVVFPHQTQASTEHNVANPAVAPACTFPPSSSSAAVPALGLGPAVKPKMTMEERQKNKFKRQEEVMQAIGAGNVTEKTILDNVGDSRYTREILRRLLAQGVVARVGKGGSNDPFLYTVVQGMVSKDGKALTTHSLADPGLEVRLRRIETKITAQLSKSPEFTTEKAIRLLVGDNTGTGKALRRLVAGNRVLRIGKGGVSDPYRYKYNTAYVAPPDAPAPAAASTHRPTAESAGDKAPAASGGIMPAFVGRPVQSKQQHHKASPQQRQAQKAGLDATRDPLVSAARARIAAQREPEGGSGGGKSGSGNRVGSPYQADVSPKLPNTTWFNFTTPAEGSYSGDSGIGDDLGLPVELGESPDSRSSRSCSSLSDRNTPPMSAVSNAPTVVGSTCGASSKFIDDAAFLAASFFS